MDLATVLTNINEGKYKTVEECLSDIQLIWSNCKTYNMPESDIYKMAEAMEKVTKKSIQKLKFDIKKGEYICK